MVAPAASTLRRRINTSGCRHGFHVGHPLADAAPAFRALAGPLPGSPRALELSANFQRSAGGSSETGQSLPSWTRLVHLPMPTDVLELIAQQAAATRIQSAYRGFAVRDGPPPLLPCDGRALVMQPRTVIVDEYSFAHFCHAGHILPANHMRRHWHVHAGLRYVQYSRSFDMFSTVVASDAFITAHLEEVD